jgi:TetR/AcrR family transcriptional regulator, cholesterol catabolism regulator
MESSRMAQRRRAALEEDSPAYQNRRLQILAAAAEVFKEKGYQGASIDDVAQRVGTDRASIYYYVSGKRELFETVVGGIVANNVAVTEAISASDDPAPIKLRQVIRRAMQSFEKHYPYLYVFVQEDLIRLRGSDDSPWNQEVQGWADRHLNAIIRIIDQGQREGSFRTDISVAHAANALMGMVSWTHRWFRPTESPATAEEIADDFITLLMDGLVVAGSRRSNR